MEGEKTSRGDGRNWSRASPNQLPLRPQNQAPGARIIITPSMRRKYVRRYISGSSIEAATLRTANAALAMEPLPGFRPFVGCRVQVSAPGFSGERVQQVDGEARPPQTPQLSNKSPGGRGVLLGCNACWVYSTGLYLWLRNTF